MTRYLTLRIYMLTMVALWLGCVQVEQTSRRGPALPMRILLQSYLLLRGDVVVDEGHPLIGPLTPHAGDPCHRHLAGLDGRLCAVAAKFCLLLQQHS